MTLPGLSIADNVVKQMLELNGELWAVGRAGARHAAAVSAAKSQVWNGSRTRRGTRTGTRSATDSTSASGSRRIAIRLWYKDEFMERDADGAMMERDRFDICAYKDDPTAT